MRKTVVVSVLVALPSCAPVEPDVAGAVVALSTHNGMCTATVVELRGEVGFALTAGHCCRGSTPSEMSIFAGQDYAAAEAVFNVIKAQPHPLYEGGAARDVCVLTFAGRGVDRLSSILPMTPGEDTLVAGDDLDVVGYGATPNDAESNTQRRHLTVTLTRVDQLSGYYDQTEEGPCYGDSGGPALFAVDGAVRIAAVTSGGPKDCSNGEGANARVSSVFEDLIEPFINARPLPIPCGGCMDAAVSRVGNCVDQKETCLADSSCNALVHCYSACRTDACMIECATKYDSGMMKYQAIKACVCENACPDYCSGDALCRE